jgi:hypothetical protein
MRGHKFSFPDDPPIAQPQATVRLIRQFDVVSAFLASWLMGGMVVIVVLTGMLLYRAEIIPYVADGGEFGCKVPVQNGMERN